MTASPRSYSPGPNPGTAATKSFLMVGMGQIYNGQTWKGVGFAISVLFSVLLIVFLVRLIGALGSIALILLPALWIYSIFDAYNTAKKINAGLVKVDKWKSQGTGPAVDFSKIPQCPHCQGYNVPGVNTCRHCGKTLAL